MYTTCIYSAHFIVLFFSPYGGDNTKAMLHKSEFVSIEINLPNSVRTIDHALW